MLNEIDRPNVLPASVWLTLFIGILALYYVCLAIFAGEQELKAPLLALVVPFVPIALVFLFAKFVQPIKNLDSGRCAKQLLATLSSVFVAQNLTFVSQSQIDLFQLVSHNNLVFSLLVSATYGALGGLLYRLINPNLKWPESLTYATLIVAVLMFIVV